MPAWLLRFAMHSTVQLVSNHKLLDCSPLTLNHGNTMMFHNHIYKSWKESYVILHVSILYFVYKLFFRYDTIISLIDGTIKCKHDNLLEYKPTWDNNYTCCSLRCVIREWSSGVTMLRSSVIFIFLLCGPAIVVFKKMLHNICNFSNAKMVKSGDDIYFSRQPGDFFQQQNLIKLFIYKYIPPPPHTHTPVVTPLL